jgi:GDP-4-dehydro-6-deoxy-D-mannose reductase
MINTILVTGSTGFVGKYLLPALCKAFPEATVIGLCRHKPLSILPAKLTYQVCDLTDRPKTIKVVNEIKPDCVINLAAISHIPTAFSNPDLTWDVNLHGMLNLLNALAGMNQPCTFLQVGSADCYGQAFSSGETVDEKTPFMPMNPYSASKAAADLAAYSYRHQGKLKIIRARPFNHSGAGQSDDFVIPSFAKQIARIEQGKQPAKMSVGDLTAQRCFLHVQDVVDAYVSLLIHRDKILSGEAFNIVSEEPTIIKSILDKLLLKSDMTIDIQKDPSKQRPSDILVAKGSALKINELTQWTPEITLDFLLGDVLNHFRKELDD